MNWEIVGIIIALLALSYTYLRNFKLDVLGRFDKVEGRFDKVELEIKEIRTSINRIEGALMAKDCCLLKDKNVKEKAE